MASSPWCRGAAQVRALSVAVACVGVAWAWRRRRSTSREERSGAVSGECKPASLLVAQLLEDPRLEEHANAAVRLNGLRFTVLAHGKVETSFYAEVPFGIVCAARPRSLAATAAVMLTAGTAALLALEAAVAVSLGLSLLVILVGGFAAATIAVRWQEVKALAASKPRAAVARARVEVRPDAAEGIWNAAAAWAAAGRSAPGRVRSSAWRGDCCVLVEACPSVLVAAPLTAFILEPCAEGAGGGAGALQVSAYAVPTSRRAAAEVAAQAVAQLSGLLGKKDSAGPPAGERLAGPTSGGLPGRLCGEAGRCWSKPGRT